MVAFPRCGRTGGMAERAPLTVLVIDDDEVDREAVRRSLRGTDTVVHEAASVADGLAALRQGLGRVVVLADINMPGESGFDFLDSVRADEALSSTVVFMLTSSSRDSDIEQAYRRQVAGYMVKGESGPKMSHLSALLSTYDQAVRLPAPR